MKKQKTNATKKKALTTSIPTTQDDTREKQIIKYFKLTPVQSRILHDAEDIFLNPYEAKSVTKKKGVSTARQVHLAKIAKWRTRYWIFAKGPSKGKGMQIEEIYIHHPSTLEPFFKQCEQKIEPIIALGEQVITALEGQKFDFDIIRTTFERGSRLDDPTISWKLVQTGLALPIDDTDAATKILADFVAANPLAGDLAFCPIAISA